MARSLSGEATAEEQNQLLLLLQKDEALQQQFDIMQRLWQNSEPPGNVTEDEEDKKLQHILSLAKQEENNIGNDEPYPDYFPVKRRRSIRKYIFPVSVVAALSFSFWLWQKSASTVTASQKKIPSQIIESKNGSRSRTLLPDGSTVWLNAGSAIYYKNEDFNNSSREVRLEGEAFFDIVKQSGKPFIVHASVIDIKVLGTAFNVKSYPADKTVETTLIRGLVQVTVQGAAQQKPIVLHPNEKLTLQKNAAEISAPLSDNNTFNPPPSLTNFKVTPIDTNVSEDAYVETAWMYNRLAFRGDSFEELAKKLERWYNVEIVFEDDKVKLLNFNGSFENENIQQAFTALKAAVPFTYTIDGSRIYVKSM